MPKPASKLAGFQLPRLGKHDSSVKILHRGNIRWGIRVRLVSVFSFQAPYGLPPMNAVKKMLPQFHSLYTAPRNEPVKEYVPLGKLSPQEGWGFSEVFHCWGRYRRCTRKGWHIMVKASRYFFNIYPKDPSWFKEEFLKNDNRGQRIH